MITTDNSFDRINKFWFGRVEETIVPSQHRARVWFGEDKDIDEEMRSQFGGDLERAILGEFDHWKGSPRGQLALIIAFDQLSRHIYRDSPLAFAQDSRALDICMHGVSQEMEHQLSLIERVFYYFPLLHSETLYHQEQSIQAYTMLSELAFAETRVIYDSFLKFANHHYSIIQRFGRFPQRNIILGRKSTPEEILYLEEADSME